MKNGPYSKPTQGGKTDLSLQLPQQRRLEERFPEIGGWRATGIGSVLQFPFMYNEGIEFDWLQDPVRPDSLNLKPAEEQFQNPETRREFKNSWERLASRPVGLWGNRPTEWAIGELLHGVQAVTILHSSNAWGTVDGLLEKGSESENQRVGFGWALLPSWGGKE